MELADANLRGGCWRRRAPGRSSEGARTWGSEVLHVEVAVRQRWGARELLLWRELQSQHGGNATDVCLHTRTEDPNATGAI